MKIIKNHPKSWKVKALSSFIQELESGVSVNSDDTVAESGKRILKTSCVSNGRFDITQSKNVVISETDRVKCPIKNGAIIISRMNTPDLVGASGLVMEDSPSVFLPDRLWQTVWNDCTDFEPRWLAQILISEHGRTFLKSIASGSSGSMKNISKTQFLSALIPTPSLPEQRKIADILSTWDDALEKIDALIANKTSQKNLLMQQLLTGKTRVKGAKGKWKSSSLADMLVPITRTVPKPAGKFLAAGIRSHGKGVFLKPDFNPEDIALDELFEIKAGDLIVNITFAWEGAAAIVSEQADGALVSHRFPTFLFKDGVASCSFFRHYIRSKRFIFDCGLASPGGAGRNRVLSKSAFLDIELKTPPFEEQQQIGLILDTADQELTLLRTQRQTLDQQKRGLMQRLLTGKIRIKL